MITKEKLEIYRHFNGDIDGWARIGTSTQKRIMSDKDWGEIDNILQDLLLVNGKTVSDEFKKKIYENLKTHTDNESTMDEILSMSCSNKGD